MQLRRHDGIRTALTAITATLLGSSGSAHASDSGKVESSLLLYSESNRVKAAENVIDFSKQIDDRRSFLLRLTLDGLTGASPNGATPASTVQTFTGASGRVGFRAPPGQIPLDNTFKDQRLGLDGSVTDLLDRLTSVTYGGHLSIEHDYGSIGINGGISRDFNRKNTTFNLSAALGHDFVSPIGGAPSALSSMPAPTEPSTGDGENEGEGGAGPPGKGKEVVDAVVGINQVLDRNTFVRLDYSYGLSSGYLNDPYKLLSVVQDWGSAAPGEPVDYLYESRPSLRNRQAVFADVRRYVFGATIDASYRYFWDDWGITSRSVDLFTRVPLGRGHSIEPHYRWYRQSAADFYRTYLVEGQVLPRYASADNRLNAFDAVTLGLKYTMPFHGADRISFSSEYYTQTGSRGPPDAIGILSQYDLFPKMNVVMFRVGFTHGF